MQKLTPFIACALSGLALAAAAAPWLAGAGTTKSNAACDLWSLPQAIGRMHDANCKSEQLDLTLAEIGQRLEKKRALAAALVERRLTLAEALPQVRRLIAECKYAPTIRFLYYPDLSDLEYAARDVFEWVRGELLHEPARQRQVIERLEAELRCLRAETKTETSTPQNR